MTAQSVFKQQLDALLARSSSRKRRWLFVPPDQLNDALGPLAHEPAGELGIVLIESHEWANRRPWHRQRLALQGANQRHFALEQAARGVAVVYRPTPGTLIDALREELGNLRGSARVMEPAEWELRAELAPLVREGLLQIIPHEGWLSTQQDFMAAAPKGPPWRMDAFYRVVRRRTGILMDGNGKPTGGQFSFDGDNRQPWPGTPPAPTPPTFAPDAITREVIDAIGRDFPRHPGCIDPAQLPATKADAARLWQWAKDECLALFGPYEDAMSMRSSGLFHTRLSALMNLGRVLPREVVSDVAAMDIPLASKEGFIRQVLGWREFVRHVHDATDGFRHRADGGAVAVAERPGDGGWSRWRGEGWASSTPPKGIDGGAVPSHLDANEPLPAAYWGAASGLHCLDTVVGDVWREGWSHHITRLMVLGNIATLMGVAPRPLADWFWVAYVDAWDWVVEPNVLAMATYGVGEVMTTKPYVSGAAYIHRMSDYCGGCAFDPKTNCPLTAMYWNFLARNREHLAGNMRIAMPMRSLAKRHAAKQDEDARITSMVREVLARGERLSPAHFEKRLFEDD